MIESIMRAMQESGLNGILLFFWGLLAAYGMYKIADSDDPKSTFSRKASPYIVFIIYWISVFSLSNYSPTAQDGYRFRYILHLVESHQTGKAIGLLKEHIDGDSIRVPSEFDGSKYAPEPDVNYD